MRFRGCSLPAALVLGLGACNSEPPPPVPGEAPPLSVAARSYVSLGDSYVSGPGIDPEMKASGSCRRSGSNWPAMVAEDLSLPDAVDVSCAGASTRHLVSDVPADGALIPAQLTALEPTTDLVTVGVGANDANGILGGLVGACSRESMPSDGACVQFVRESLPSLLSETVKPQVVDVLREIRRRSPEAAVLLVGYTRLASGSDTCPQLGVGGRELKPFVEGERMINESLREAAATAGVQFLDTHALSEGHDVCAGDPWVNGTSPPEGDGVILHPNAQGMAAVTDAVVTTLRED